jgi:ABC-type dipeptide/oligopeptide/nickel transport system permease component
MGRWLTRRLAIAFITLIGITMVVFVLMRLAPVDPVDLLVLKLQTQGGGGGLTAADVDKLRQRLRQELGLSDPIFIQYLLWLREVITHGTLGYSFENGRPSLDVVFERVPPTLMLMGTAFIIQVVIGVPLGILAALRHNRLTDYLVSAFGLSVVAVPTFFLCLAAIYVFSVQLRVLPPGGMFDPTQPHVDPIDVLRHLFLPAVILGLAGVGPILRYVRAAILETLSRDYLVTARAKGLSSTMTIVRHAFPNALLPLITFLGLQVGGLLAGAFVIEQVMTWPGLGKLALDAIKQRDYPVIQAFAVVTGVMVVIGNVLADLAYGIADPRIGLE